MSASIWNPGTPTSNVLAPNAPVPFVPGAVGAPGITFAGDLDTGIWQQAAGYLNFSVNGTNVLTLSPTGILTVKTLATQPEAIVASGATVDLGGLSSNRVFISGTTAITSFGTNYNGPLFVRFGGSLTLTNSAALILPGGANITTASNDTAVVVPKSTTGADDGWIVVSYQRSNGLSVGTVSDLSNSVRVDVASAGTVDLVAGAGNVRNINITGTTAITGFTINAGSLFFVRFAGSLTLTNGAGLTIQSGSNITTAAGDTCILRALAANAVEVLCYTPANPLTVPSPAGKNGQWLTNNGTSSNWSFLTRTRQSARNANTILAAADCGSVIPYSGAVTQTFTAAATLGAGWWVELQNVSTADVILSTTIDGVASGLLKPGMSLTVYTDGTNFYCFRNGSNKVKEIKTATGAFTWTAPLGVRSASIYQCGSGRGGQGGSTSGSSCGISGDAGAELEVIIPVVPGTVYSGSIGAGGAGGTAAGPSGNAGVAGTDTTFTANSVTYTAATSGGNATNGLINLTGQSAQNSNAIKLGGSTRYGRGGWNDGNTSSIAGTGYGYGGAGGLGTGGGSTAGQTGGNGLWVVEY